MEVPYLVHEHCTVLYEWCSMCAYRVGPLYKGHIGTSHFVHCREVVLSSEVKVY